MQTGAGFESRACRGVSSATPTFMPRIARATPIEGASLTEHPGWTLGSASG